MSASPVLLDPINHPCPADYVPDEGRRAAWLADRRTCITGTEISAILGLNPWMRPIDVFLEKKGQRTFEGNEATRAGKRFERAILEETAERAGRPLAFADPFQLIKVPGFPLLGATLDARWLDGDRRPVDAKNIRFKDADWGDDGSDEFPDYYRLQLHIQAMATETHGADLAVCFTGQTFETFTYHRDSEIDDLLKEEAESWWKRHILADVAPEPDGSESFSEYLKNRFKRNALDLVDAAEESANLVARLKAAKDLIEINEREKALFEQQLKLIIGDHEGIRGLCTWKNNRDSEVTDWKCVSGELRRMVFNTTDALAAIGAIGDGYCFCLANRDPSKPDEQHTGECRAARAAIEETDRANSITYAHTTTKPGARVFRLSK